MQVIVCIKQVPSTTEVRLDPVTHTMIRDAQQAVINPFDTYALEEGVRLKERYGGKVSVLSMGIPATAALLRDALSRGADQALLLSDRAFAGADTLATAYALSCGVGAIGPYDLILCGKMAIDGDTAQTGPALAETLGIPQITDVCEILAVAQGRIRCRKQCDAGEQVVEVPLPALLTVVKNINRPRFASIAGIRQSEEAKLACYGAQDLGADTQRTGLNGSPTQVWRTFVPQQQRQVVQYRGTAAEQAEQIYALLAAQDLLTRGC